MSVMVLPIAATPMPASAAVVPRIVAVDAGYAHACAVTSEGELLCWGYGLHGALGDGAAVSRVRPVPVVGLATGVRAVDAGGFFTCALTTDGAVRCWGWNRSGQLGDGTTTERTTPVDVVGLGSGVMAIAVGGAHACALMVRGDVRCWGNNQGGQLGDGTTTQRRSPVAVVGLAGPATAISAGGGHTCAVLAGGSLRCWGAGYAGQLGVGSGVVSAKPVTVTGAGTAVRGVSAGAAHTCAITAAGIVRCWGQNRSGELGDGSRTDRLSPVAVVGLPANVEEISVGQTLSCSRTRDGTAWCWGANRSAGQVGSGSDVDHLVPVAVAGLTGVDSIRAGYLNACALVARGVACWGDNTYGQLGDGTRRMSRTPVAVDFATHQMVALTSTAPAGSLAAGTAVTFVAHAAPVSPGTGGAVRFEIYRRDGTVWRLAARRDVPIDATGRASLRWTFATTGGRSVRALALANAVYAASPWSPRIVYSVE